MSSDAIEARDTTIATLTADLAAERAEVERLRVEVARQQQQRTNRTVALTAATVEVVRLRAEVEGLRSWIDRQEPRDVYEATVCPICHKATERRYMRAVESHLDDCPWQEARNA